MSVLLLGVDESVTVQLEITFNQGWSPIISCVCPRSSCRDDAVVIEMCVVWQWMIRSVMRRSVGPSASRMSSFGRTSCVTQREAARSLQAKSGRSGQGSNKLEAWHDAVNAAK